MAEDLNQTMPLWPAGTVTDASTTHPPFLDQVTGAAIYFDSSAAVDNNRSTKWNDNTEYEFPDWLQITPPVPVYLGGLVVLSEVGWITDFSIAVNAEYSVTNWTTAATVHDDQNILTNITFPQALACSQLNITIYNSSTGDYSRIIEVYPRFAALPSSPASTGSPSPSSTHTPTTTPTAPTSDATTNTGLSSGAKAGIGVGAAIGGILVLLAAMLLFFRKRRTNTRQHNRSEYLEWPATREPTEIGKSEVLRELDGSQRYSGRGVGPGPQATNELE